MKLVVYDKLVPLWNGTMFPCIRAASQGHAMTIDVENTPTAPRLLCALPDIAGFLKNCGRGVL